MKHSVSLIIRNLTEAEKDQVLSMLKETTDRLEEEEMVYALNTGYYSPKKVKNQKENVQVAASN